MIRESFLKLRGNLLTWVKLVTMLTVNSYVCKKYRGEAHKNCFCSGSVTRKDKPQSVKLSVRVQRSWQLLTIWTGDVCGRRSEDIKSARFGFCSKPITISKASNSVWRIKTPFLFSCFWQNLIPRTICQRKKMTKAFDKMWQAKFLSQ